jgi:hypothetical protein
MVKRLRPTWLAGSGAMALVLSISGLVAAATIVAAGTAPVTAPVTAAQPFVDVNGDGIDDTCQTNVVANPLAAAAAQLAVDVNGDGVISISEAAASGRIGGTNCNHGGYVSVVAHSFGPACDGTETAAGTETSDASETDNSETVTTVTTATTTTDTTTTDTTTCSTDSTLAAVTTTSETASTTTCTTTTSSTTDTTTSTTDTAPNAHGKAVSEVAQSDAVGGKNCNHGGAVSEAAHQNHAARDAAKAARNAAKDARNLNKVHGKGHNH